jgi:hypothetical protein
MEPSIVVAVIDVFSVVALPRYLQARNSASAGIAVGEALDLVM